MWKNVYKEWTQSESSRKERVYVERQREQHVCFICIVPKYFSNVKTTVF